MNFLAPVFSHARRFDVTLKSGNLLRRVLAMGWDEIQARTCQEVRKRVDLVRCRIGVQGRPRLLKTAIPASFFFEDCELASLTTLIRENLPQQVESTVCEADQICRHQFELLGYSAVDYGDPIDWHRDAVHHVRAPFKPWFRIPFLDFATVGDHKIIWELNRHQHLPVLAKAWRYTGKERYTQELFRQWYQWQSANPYPMGINWCSSLEVAMRSFSWLWVRALLADHASTPAGFSLDLLQALALNGRHIENYISTYFSPNTHLLGEAAALFFIGTLCPEIPQSAHWQLKGWRLLLEEARRQVRPDGVYFEQALHYHVYALDMFLHCRRLAIRNHMQVPENFDRIVQRMLDVLQALSQAAPPESFGDDDGGRFFDPRRNRSFHLTDPLLIGTLTFDRDEFHAAPALTEEALWLFGRCAVERRLAAVDKRVQSACFKDGGIFVMACAQPGSECLVIDAGPQGTGRSGHGHADALSLSLAFDGRGWLVDSGTFAYSQSQDQRDAFRGTAAHNTLRVDNLEQAIPEGPFAWSAVPCVCAERWVVGESFSFFRGSHTGYERLADPVTHRRSIFHLHGGFWLVHDSAEGNDVHELELNWHFAPDLCIERAAGGFLAVPCHAGVRPLAILPMCGSPWKVTLQSGVVSPVYGHREKAAILQLKAQVKLPVHHALLLAPCSPGVDRLGHFWQVTEPAKSNSASRAYCYDDGARVHFMAFAGEGHCRQFGSWNSDAEFLYGCTQADQLVRLIACGASFVGFGDKTIFHHQHRVERCEWQIDDVVVRTPRREAMDGQARPMSVS